MTNATTLLLRTAQEKHRKNYTRLQSALRKGRFKGLSAAQKTQWLCRLARYETRLRQWGFALASGAALLLPATGQAQSVPAGMEFRVNTWTTSIQTYPAIATDDDGNFIVVWNSSGQDGDLYGIYAQRYNNAGVALGSEFQVNTWTTNLQTYPAVAMDSDGDFVVVWHSSGQDGSGYGIYAQQYNSAGTPLGSEFQVNTWTTNNQLFSSIAMDSDGDFVIAWNSFGQDGSLYGIYAQQYNSTGTPQGAEFQVNTWTTNGQREPAIAMDSDGDFVVTWYSEGQDGSSTGIYGQRFSSVGIPLGSEFRVNTWTTDQQRIPSIAMDNDGDFVVTWYSFGQDGSGFGIFAQRFDSAGVPQGTNFRVNTWTTDAQLYPKIAMDSAGDFVITWYSALQDGSQSGIYVQQYNNAGVPQGAEFLVNTWTTDVQRLPDISMDSDGDFIITWQSNLQDGSNYGIYVQRYHNPSFPVELTDFRGEATDAGNLLEWTTASEKDNQGFDVERSSDGRNFETVGFVPGHGTVQEAQEYRFTDQPHSPGIHYYRLRQTDFGGSQTYSDIIAIAPGHWEPVIVAYPNPAGDVLYIAFAPAGGALYNALGKPVLYFNSAMETTTLDISRLPAGIYWAESAGQRTAVVKR